MRLMADVVGFGPSGVLLHDCLQKKCVFFFEKKNQKTFSTSDLRRPHRRRPAPL